MITRIARQISFFAPAAIMGAWGVVMLHTFMTGHLSRLLAPMFRNYVLATSLLLFVLSILYLLLYQPESENGSVPNFRQFGRWMALLMPILAASILSPSAISSITLVKHGSGPTADTPAMPTWYSVSQENAKKVLEADSSQPVPIEVTELVTISRSPDEIKVFEGRKVRSVGWVFSKPDGTRKLVRGIMWCCAADIIPVSVDLSGNTAGDWKENQWLEIVGTATFPSTLGHVTPRIEVDTIRPTDEPDEPYLSPSP
jgi:putative membrane protein